MNKLLQIQELGLVRDIPINYRIWDRDCWLYGVYTTPHLEVKGWVIGDIEDNEEMALFVPREGSDLMEIEGSLFEFL